MIQAPADEDSKHREVISVISQFFFKTQPFWPSWVFTTPRGTRLVPMRRRPVASPVRQSLADVSFLDVKVIGELLQRLPDHLREQAKQDLQRRLNPDSRQRLGISRVNRDMTFRKCLGKKHKVPFLTPMLVFATWNAMTPCCRAYFSVALTVGRGGWTVANLHCFDVESFAKSARVAHGCTTRFCHRFLSTEAAQQQLHSRERERAVSWKCVQVATKTSNIMFIGLWITHVCTFK